MPLASYQFSSEKIWPGACTPTIAEGDALDDDVAPDRVRAAEELRGERRADDGDRRAAALVVFGQARARARSAGSSASRTRA